MKATNKKVSIGIFAHNEADNIIATLESLAQQDVFAPVKLPDCDITVFVLANGCTDETVPIAEAYLRKSPALDGNIVVIDKPGKSNAWNEFIHSSESESADYFVCMDSDITFGDANVLSTLIDRLSASEEAYLAVDVAQKDTLLKTHKTMFEKVSLAFSQMMKQGSTAVAGSLYCAKGDQLRKIHMPDGLPVEDGFLRAMLVTDLFTKKDNNQRILVVDDVCHYFTPDPSIRSLLRHEERLLIGTFINSVIYGFLWHEVPRTGKDAGQIVAKKNIDNPNWLEDLIANYREGHSPLIPTHFYYKYWKRWKNLRLPIKIISLPIITLGTVIKYFLLKKVERRLSRESGVGTW
ncbi:glycosyltransferase family 2 protein [Porticoccaceae bacterium]|nr:glycosyltransferase family 2 protein [Porticoccaceae bacterium]